MPSLDNNQLQGGLGAAIAAVLSSDLELRQALLKGACFFALAAGKANHSRPKEGQGQWQQHQLEAQEAQAEDVVALVESSVKKVVEQVGRLIFWQIAQCMGLCSMRRPRCSSGSQAEVDIA